MRGASPTRTCAAYSTSASIGRAPNTASSSPWSSWRERAWPPSSHPRPPLTLAEAFPLLAQLAAGLEAAHAAGVIHRDLKPANAMLVPTEAGEPRVVVTDFGMAISVDQLDLGLTETWEMIGTPEYMAPEQTKRGAATPATDVYALGLIAYEMVSKARPFEPEGTPLATVVKRRYELARPLRQALPGVAPAWDAAVARCLEAEPARRFQAARRLHRRARRGAGAPGSRQDPVAGSDARPVARSLTP